MAAQVQDISGVLGDLTTKISACRIRSEQPSSPVGVDTFWQQLTSVFGLDAEFLGCESSSNGKAIYDFVVKFRKRKVGRTVYESCYLISSATAFTVISRPDRGFSLSDYVKKEMEDMRSLYSSCDGLAWFGDLHDEYGISLPETRLTISSQKLLDEMGDSSSDEELGDSVEDVESVGNIISQLGALGYTSEMIEKGVRCQRARVELMEETAKLEEMELLYALSLGSAGTGFSTMLPEFLPFVQTADDGLEEFVQSGIDGLSELQSGKVMPLLDDAPEHHDGQGQYDFCGALLGDNTDFSWE
jgi:hypothetical protein